MSKIFHFNEEKGKRERRSDLYLWESFEHLKDAYFDYINPKEIDEIASQVRKSGKFKKRVGLTSEENGCCLCNLIDSLIMERLDKKFHAMKKQPDNVVHMEDYKVEL